MVSKAASTFRKSDVKRAIQAAEAAGMKVARVDIYSEGKISVVTATGATAEAQPKPQDSLDNWIASHPRVTG